MKVSPKSKLMAKTMVVCSTLCTGAVSQHSSNGPVLEDKEEEETTVPSFQDAFNEAFHSINKGKYTKKTFDSNLSILPI